jgi:hypothetical protein
MFVAKRWQAAALAVVVAAFEASLRRRNATIIAICVRTRTAARSAAVLQHPSQVLPLLDLPRRERLEGSPGAPGRRNTTQKGHSGRLLSGPSTRGPAPTLTQTAFAAGLRTRAVTALADRPRNRCSGPRGSPGIAGGTACARVSGQPRGQPRASHHGGDHGRRQPETEVREDAREKTTPARVRSCVEIKLQAPHAIDATSSL